MKSKEEQTMKKMKFMLFAAAIVAAASCAKEIAPENNSGNTSDLNLIPMTFTAGTEDVDSKVALQQDGLTLHWESSDQIKVFDGSENDLDAFTTTGSGASADFTGSVTTEEGPYYALYPYQADASYGLDESAENRPTIYAEVPAVQTAVAGSVPSNAFVAVAKSDDHNYFKFSTICGYIKYTLNQDNVESITFSGNNNESLTGKVKIYFNADGIANQTYVSGAMKPTVTLTGDLKNGETYYAAIRPTSFTKGLTVSILYKDGTRSYMTTDTAPSEGVKANVVMNFIAPPAYNTTVPNDNFIAYIHGYDLGLPAGASYQEIVLLEASAEDGSSKLLSNLKGSKDRIIFLTAADESAFTLESVAGMDKHIAVVGRYKGVKPTIIAKNYFRTKHGSFLMKNIAIDASQLGNVNYIFNHSNAEANYGQFIIDGCWIKGLGKVVWQNAGGIAYSCDKYIFKNNKVEVAADAISIFNFYRPVKSADIEIKNNIFYAAADAEGNPTDKTGFKVVSHTAAADISVGLTIDNIVLNNNSFVNLYFNKQGYVNANKIIKAEVKSNLLSVPNYYTHTVNDEGKLQYWGILFAYGRKTVTSAGTTYDEFVQYEDLNATETQTVTAKEGTNPNYYPVQGQIDVNYNTTYRTKPDDVTTNIYPKASFLDLKLREGVFCSKGSYYTGINNPSTVTEEVFATPDFVNGIFTQKDAYITKGAVITE